MNERDTMSPRTVHTVWEGGLAGSGYIDIGDLKADLVRFVGSTPGTAQARVSTSSEASDAPVTSKERFFAGAQPEELLAAAFSASFVSQLAATLTGHGGTVKLIEVAAIASFDATNAAGIGLPRITLTVYGDVSNITADVFSDDVRTAHELCPFGDAFGGVDITIGSLLN
jgi:organic hydroperoxide reductase OsmC/OhrA